MSKKLTIFRAGSHTDSQGRPVSFGEADLAATAKAYDPARHKAPLVIGHPADNGPAWGWVAGLAAEGGALFAEVDPVAEIKDLVDRGFYRKLSASFYRPDAPANPTPGVWSLRHVGLLGATPPAVKGLPDVAFAGAAEDFVVVEFGESDWLLAKTARMFRSLRDFFVAKFGLETADRVLPSWEVDSAQEGAAVAAQTDPGFSEPREEEKDMHKDKDQRPAGAAQPAQGTPGGARGQGGERPAAPEGPAVELSEQARANAARLAGLEKEVAAFREGQALADARGVVAKVVADGRLTPALASGVAEFMASLPGEGETVCFGEGDKAVKQTPRAFFTDLLGRLPKQVNFGEVAAPDGAEPGGLTADALADRAKAYHAAKKRDGVDVSFTEAVDAVKRGEKV